MTLPAAFLDRPIAHRALHDARVAENSVGAIEAAIEAGYGIEIDIQPSRDGVPMVFHDYDLKRLTGKGGAVAQRTSEELGQIPLLGGGGAIPTLKDVLARIAGRVPVLIEIKDQDGQLGPRVGALEQAVCEVLADYKGPAALMSFNPHSVAACALHAPHIPRGLTTCAFPAENWPMVPAQTREALAQIPDFDRVGACFTSHQTTDLIGPAVTALKALNVPILCWTVRSAAEEIEARKIADNITFEGYRA